MYHRVARPAHDPWQLAVSPERFAEQIEALVQLRPVVPLRWLAAQLAHGRLPPNVAVVTFDDGYSDLLFEARPVLERYSCPATVFLVSGAIGGRGFWWDELSRIVFEPPVLPPELCIEVAGRMHRWRCDSSTTSSSGTATPGDGPGSSREELHAQLYLLLRPLDPDPRRERLKRLRTWAGFKIQCDPADRPLSAEEVRRLSAPGYIDIGAHTVTHPALSLLDDANRWSEIEGSRRACRELTGVRIHMFAYPYGDLNDATAECTHSAGFACACTTQQLRVSMSSDLMRLPRFGVGNWEGADFARRLDRLEGIKW